MVRDAQQAEEVVHEWKTGYKGSYSAASTGGMGTAILGKGVQYDAGYASYNRGVY